jgi:hypothetical protein
MEYDQVPLVVDELRKVLEPEMDLAGFCERAIPIGCISQWCNTFIDFAGNTKHRQGVIEICHVLKNVHLREWNEVATFILTRIEAMNGNLEMIMRYSPMDFKKYVRDKYHQTMTANPQAYVFGNPKLTYHYFEGYLKHRNIDHAAAIKAVFTPIERGDEFLATITYYDGIIWNYLETSVINDHAELYFSRLLLNIQCDIDIFLEKFLKRYGEHISGPISKPEIPLIDYLTLECKQNSLDLNRAIESVLKPLENGINFTDSLCTRIGRELPRAKMWLKRYCSGGCQLGTLLRFYSSVDHKIFLEFFWSKYAESFKPVITSEQTLDIPKSPQPEESLCIICFDAKPEMLIAPCNHLCLCVNCAKTKLHKCPMCRFDITGISKVFFV